MQRVENVVGVRILDLQFGKALQYLFDLGCLSLLVGLGILDFFFVRSAFWFGFEEGKESF